MTYFIGNVKNTGMSADAAVFMLYCVCDLSCVSCWIIKFLGNQDVEVVVMVLGLNLARLPATLYEISMNFFILVSQMQGYHLFPSSLPVYQLRSPSLLNSEDIWCAGLHSNIKLLDMEAEELSSIR